MPQPYREKASGKDMQNRPKLAKAIDSSPTKGVLVLAEQDRATRGLIDGIHIMERVHKRGAFIKVLDRPGLDLTTPSGRGILAFLSGLAEEERTRASCGAPTRAASPPSSAAPSSAANPSSTTISSRKPSTGSKPVKASGRIAKSNRVHHATIARLAG